jgi:D-sedoheptulose 7-phosphate isomerase
MEKLVFTNGCFDIIHPGHVDLLKQARSLGTKLVVGINSDSSVRKIKGSPRPYFSEADRAEILKNLRWVDEVRIFDESTPENLIEEIRPDVLVKGGDWQTNEIIGAQFVLSYGGEVFSIPLKPGYSSSAVVEKIKEPLQSINGIKNLTTEIKDLIVRSLKSHNETIAKILENEVNQIERCAELIYQTFKTGRKVLLCGNGGSAADAQHIAAEFVGRYETERRALPAIALTTDTSALTALANDYNFERVFARQIEALAQNGDLLIAISTSGNSPNISAAVMKARQIGCKTLALTGSKGKKLASLCDESILAPAERTARIQESHILIAHIWCEIIDRKIKITV